MWLATGFSELVTPEPATAGKDGSASPSTETTPLLPTPTANNYETSPEVFLPRRDRLKAKGINGNGFGLTLSMAVQMVMRGASTSYGSKPVDLQ